MAVALLGRAERGYKRARSLTVRVPSGDAVPRAIRAVNT